MYRVAASSEACLRRFYTGTTAMATTTPTRLLGASTANPTIRAWRPYSTGSTAAVAAARSIRSAPILQHRSYPASALPGLSTRPIPFARTSRVHGANVRRRFTSEAETIITEEEVGGECSRHCHSSTELKIPAGPQAIGNPSVVIATLDTKLFAAAGNK